MKSLWILVAAALAGSALVVGGGAAAGLTTPALVAAGVGSEVCNQVAWSGFDGTTFQIWVADPDGTNRTKISSISPGTDPINNGFPAWRGRESDLALATAATGLKAAETATVTVTNSGPCQSYDIVVTGLSLPCVAAPSVSATAGSVAGSTWTIPTLAAGATATATISGTANGGACSSALSLTGLPSTAASVWATLGGQTCPTAATGFTDVSATSFASADIACIKGLGITTGTTTTTYSPNDNVTREQMAAFLARLWRIA